MWNCYRNYFWYKKWTLLPIRTRVSFYANLAIYDACLYFRYTISMFCNFSDRNLLFLPLRNPAFYPTFFYSMINLILSHLFSIDRPWSNIANVVNDSCIIEDFPSNLKMTMCAFLSSHSPLPFLYSITKMDCWFTEVHSCFVLFDISWKFGHYHLDNGYTGIPLYCFDICAYTQQIDKCVYVCI